MAHDGRVRTPGRRYAIAVAGLLAGMISAALLSHEAPPPETRTVRIAI